MERIVLYTKDIQVLTGKGERAARNIQAKIRSLVQKPDDVPITIYDLALFLNCEASQIRSHLQHR